MDMQDQEKFDLLWRAIEEWDVETFERELEGASPEVLGVERASTPADPIAEQSLRQGIKMPASSTLLTRACHRGRAQMVGRLIVAAHSVQGGRWTLPPLLAAIEAWDMRTVRVLLRHGADPAQLDHTGTPCIDYALALGRFDIVWELLRASAQLPPLHLLVPQGVVRGNIDNPAVGDFLGNTALHWAAYVGDCDAIVALVNSGVVVDVPNKLGQTPGHWACAAGHLEAAQLLIKLGANTMLEDFAAQTWLAWAARRNQLRIIDHLLRWWRPSPQALNLALFCAIEEGRDRALECLLTSWADPNLCRCPPFFFIRAMGSPDALSILTEWPPLHLAVFVGRIEVASHLISAGANINARVVGVTALDIACYRHNAVAVQLLLRCGADPRLQGEVQETALHRAAEANAVECIRALLTTTADPEARDYGGRTPLMTAAESGAQGAISVLAASGADVDGCDDRQRTPLMNASRYAELAVVSHLLRLQASVHAVCADGTDALQYSIIGGDAGVVELLLAAGSDTSRRNHFGETAMDIATGRADLVELLTRYGATADPEPTDEQGTMHERLGAAE